MKYTIAVVMLVFGLVHCQDMKTDVPRSTSEKAMDMMMDMPEGFNHSQCIYRPDDKVLSCKGLVETVECSTIAEMSVLGEKKFNLFGIGMIPDFTENKLESMKYWLYPRKVDNSTYLNRTVSIENGKSVDLVLYYNEKSTEQVGFRVTDLKCYEKLVRLFADASRVPRMFRLESESNIVQEVPLFGEILVLDKAIQKRWLWGYTWSPYSWGWSGVYSPYYYYGWGK